MKSLFIIGLVLLSTSNILCTGGVHDIDMSQTPTMVGGPKDMLDRFNPEINPEDRLALDTVLNHVNQVNSDLAATGYRYNKVEKLSVQLVAGKKYDFVVSFTNDNGEIRFFQVTVWVKLWENFAQITSFKEVPAFEQVDQGTVYGGQNPRDGGLDLVNNANDIRVYQTALNSIEGAHLLTASGFHATGVSNVFTQIVAGTIYTFDVTFANDVLRVERTFTVKVILIPWQNVCEVISVEEKRVVEEQLTVQYGNKQPYQFDLESNPIDKLVFGEVHTKAMASLGAENNQWNFLEIRNATRQIVSGSVFQFDIVYRNIEKTERVYHAVVYVVPWQNLIEIQQFSLVY